MISGAATRKASFIDCLNLGNEMYIAVRRKYAVVDVIRQSVRRELVSECVFFLWLDRVCQRVYKTHVSDMGNSIYNLLL